MSAAPAHASSLLSRLPEVRGKYRENADLSATNWFRVGGPAEVLYRPADAGDLGHFMAHCPKDIPITMLGVGSNLIVRDGGIDGVVIRLGKGFTDISRKGDVILVGAGVLNLTAARFCQQEGIAGLEFLSGVPGSIGGALAMNAGAYGSMTSECLIEAEIVDRDGIVRWMSVEELDYDYRHCGGLPEGAIFTGAAFRGVHGSPDDIAERMVEIAKAREESQPIRERTGGSTFKNPPGGKKAWKLIDEAGCRGLTIGGAQMSEMHCNFMINTGAATAADLEALGEEVRRRVKEHSGILLEWEIRRVGKHG
ncbi:MAG: UDP-N-acetylmuramate dehydrogenase [Alphaproteobacteria bacterium]|nr:UDP-N-acetylmuramate dehydrogenase [Alphaproteobacteria bacterium]